MKMIEEPPLFVSLQRDETNHMRINPKKVAYEPGLRIFPFARSAGEQDSIRFSIADLMQDIEDARFTDPRHFIKGVDYQSRASALRSRAESTGSDATSPDPISNATQERSFPRTGFSKQDHDSGGCQKLGFRDDRVSIAEPAGNVKLARNV
ncbi:hypothetical protein AB4874_10935 [Thioclava sp. 15-R06ZXC-3]|uniref:Uncharacterized protein n=1 Tax=Thioclava arctica TaxID=3238301 RepID=A0ABV3TMH5_9RHOB